MLNRIFFVCLMMSVFQSEAGATVGAADRWFAAHFQSRRLACYVGATHTNFLVWGSYQGIQGKVLSGDKKFYVDHVSITDKQFKITFVNENDGPLSQDLLIFDLAKLALLGSPAAQEIQGIEYYSEGFDGTSLKSSMFCHLL